MPPPLISNFAYAARYAKGKPSAFNITKRRRGSMKQSRGRSVHGAAESIATSGSVPSQEHCDSLCDVTGQVLIWGPRSQQRAQLQVGNQCPQQQRRRMFRVGAFQRTI
jgi:hypothetical protein